MSRSDTLYGGGQIFDGQSLHSGVVARFSGNRLVGLSPSDKPRADDNYIDLAGDILSPGFVDLQVNGGDGIMLNEAATVAGLRRIATAHRRLGSVQILPTLITDTPEKTTQTVRAAIDAIRAGVPGIAGLHLEGPHLSQRRKGAHDGALIRPMTPDDLSLLTEAAAALPVLMVTLAPENVELEQVRALAKAGVVLSLGHTDASFEQASDYVAAGVSCVTHLFNAMSQMHSRAPGLVGAALTLPQLSAGIIADGVHVHPATLRAAWTAKAAQANQARRGGPSSTGKFFLVSDAMAPAGTDITRFELAGREIQRSDSRLTLADGTLAGADLDLVTAVRFLVKSCDLPLDQALAAAITTPRQVIGQWSQNSTALGLDAQDFIRMRNDLSSARPLQNSSLRDS